MSKKQPTGKMAVGSKKPAPGAASSKAVVPRGSGTMVPKGMPGPIAMKKQDGMLVPEGYTMRKIEPAKNYDVESFARAMNPDFAPRLKQLFDPETEAAVRAQQTGIYIGWRCPDFKHDCQRVNDMSKCFCGHLLGEHGKYTGKSVLVPCKQGGCKCKGFAWIPSRAEDVGEFWMQRRRNFDPSTWRAKCKCKHTHEQHEPAGMRRCKTGCGCGHFISNFLCAACDKHWEDHETFFETEDVRAANGLPVGEMYLPFAEMPHLRNIALTGDEEDDSRYLALTHGEGSIPRQRQITSGNDAPFPGQGASTKSGFKPVYD
ncbi:protein FAM221B-like [Ruditapes philippinarum]|uniref:protein FAM221B-like n=1 Tax=Ruditapes philippinarum TaxID=129788 RepID=UPI00295B23BC|nr:protein FAM221B-like [Ruditapes philippinarum]